MSPMKYVSTKDYKLGTHELRILLTALCRTGCFLRVSCSPGLS